MSVFKKKKTSCRKRASRTDGSSLLHRRETKLERDSVRLILSMPTTMQRDRPHKRAPPMRAADEKQRNTERKKRPGRYKTWNCIVACRGGAHTPKTTEKSDPDRGSASILRTRVEAKNTPLVYPIHGGTY